MNQEKNVKRNISDMFLRNQIVERKAKFRELRKIRWFEYKINISAHEIINLRGRTICESISIDIFNTSSSFLNISNFLLKVSEYFYLPRI